MTRFDAGELARGWLSVSLASSKDDERPALHKTVLVEAFSEGVRLVATDSYVLFRSWVPNVESWGADEPGLDEVPYCVAVAIDEHGRARGLMGHAMALSAAALESDDGGRMPEVRLVLGVVDEVDRSERPALAGLAPAFVSFEVPDKERLRISTYDGEFPGWRRLLAGFSPAPSTQVALDADRLAVVAKLGKYHHGARIGWAWGGDRGMAQLEVIEAVPLVAGVMMPCRWDLDTDGPRTEPEPGPSEADVVDVLLSKAGELVVDEQLGSITLLRHRLNIGSARASDLLDELERRGFVGPPLKGRPRPVLVEALDTADLDALALPKEEPA